MSNSNLSIFEIKQVDEIEKDFKKIHVQGFGEDFERFLKALPGMLEEKEFYRYQGFVEISGLGKVVGNVYKARKVHCKSLHCKDKFRVIFQVFNKKVRVIEVYYKGNRENEDRQRILKYCQTPP
ncbi:MAG: hypothetical protein Sv326_0650 [Candidatus Fermentimicrarchaeum limneticum]|uniref:Type II toxin-antitoxin system RelE/ParE family toxin n=1 Tax=Fermentimicrarchaeum limneticum TaxID=2795018 RepID=A0A7D5XC79_FERL1|nr:MAG: hypothetical protein Sv326_0650 [Candidatus Fermentimicrarchaeum limneticum]